MIVGDYYINNFLVLAVLLALVGGGAYLAGFPGGGEQEPAQPGNYALALQGGEGLSPGESKVVRLESDNGTAIRNADIFVNGESAGSTDDNGLATFQVPESSNVTVSASKSGLEVSRTFELDTDEDSTGDSDGDDSSSDGDGTGDSEDGSQDQDSQDGTEDQENQSSENDTSVEPAINRVSPDQEQLQSATFEAIYELAAENASYTVSLGGEEKASGDIDGEKTVSQQLTLSENGTAGLEAEIARNGETLVSESFTVNYTAESGASGENNETSGNQTDPGQVSAALSDPSSVQVGDSVAFDASESTGDIVNYTWSTDDGVQETTESATYQHTYQDQGTYSAQVTVNGKNNTQDSASATLEVQGLQQPVINFMSPSDGYETDQASIEYEFEVDNAASDAEYGILIDGSSATSGTLDEGNNTVQRTVEVPETGFNTAIQVKQGGETYTSEERTINPSDSVPEPDVFLRKPEGGSEYSSTEIEYNFTVYNGIESSTYRIMADGSSVKTGQLSNDGTTTLDPAVTVPEGEFTTQVEIDQGGQTYTSESVSLVGGQTASDPSVTFDHPDDGETVSETFDETTDVSLNYTVEDRGWAQEATLTLENYEGSEVGSRTQSLSSGQSYSYTFEDIPTYKQDSQAEYTWTVELTGNGETTMLGPRSFLAERLEHIDVVELHSVEQNESYSGVFNYSAMSNSMNGRILEITRGDTIITQESQFESFDINNRVEEFWIYETGQHDVQIVLRDVSTDEVVAQSQTLQFETTELPPDASGGGGT